MIITILAFIGILLVLVLVHEWGHFFAARKLGVAVEEFGFGFPPRAFGFWRGKTLYSLNWLPLGGFVKLKGEAGQNRESDSFIVQKAWRRTIILVAGVFMNVVLAFVLLSSSFVIGYPTIINGEQLGSAKDVKVQILTVQEKSPAASAAIQPGDVLDSLDGVKITSLPDAQNYIQAATKPIAVGLIRDNEPLRVEVTPVATPESNGRAVLGVGLAQTGIISYPWYEAIWLGAKETVYLLGAILSGFGALLHSLFAEARVPQDLSGPVGIAVLTGKVVNLGWIYVVQFAALLSLNLAIINILPIPALDGGRLLFVIIEKLRGKANDEKTEAIAHQIGFLLLMLLVLAVTYRDLARFGGGFMEWISRIL